MNLIACFAFALLSLHVLHAAEPVGICLHAFGPTAPPDKIECFEYVREETDGPAGNRFFLKGNGSAVISEYRLRGRILYGKDSPVGSEAFDQKLKSFEAASRTYPSTRIFLNPKILAMRAQVEARNTSIQQTNSAPKIEIAGQVYRSPVFRGIENKKLVLKHEDGVARIDLESVSDDDFRRLVKLDPTADKLRVTSLAGKRLWNAGFEGVENGAVHVKHEEGVLEIPLARITETDRKQIEAWSDGSWTIAEPGLYRWVAAGGVYEQLVLPSGKAYGKVRFDSLSGEQVKVTTDKGALNLSIKEANALPGKSEDDVKKVDTWVSQILEARKRSSSPKDKEEIEEFLTLNDNELHVTEVKARVLQVLDQGVLASHFIGTLTTGSNRIKVITYKEYQHPLTDEKIVDVVATEHVTRPVTELVKDDLCYIVGDTSKLVERDLVRVEGMTSAGRYQYVDVANRPRTIPKYLAD